MQNTDKYENFHEIGFLRRKIRECSTKVSLGEAMTTKTFLIYLFFRSHHNLLS